jgi:hypothetical protein
MAVACALLIAGITGCDKKREKGAAAETTTLTLTLAHGQTRAADPNAEAGELAVRTIDVYIFDGESLALINRTRLNAADFESAGEVNTFKNKVKIETTTGKRRVAAGVNLPDGFPDPTSIASLRGAWTTTIDQLAGAETGFVMFSDELVDATLVAESDPDHATANAVSVNVTRVVAKVAVVDAGVNLNHSIGAFSNLQFAIRNSNTKLFPLRLVENGVVKDPNWDTYDAADFEHPADYIPVNAKNADPAAWGVKYAPENTSKVPVEKNSTYAVIRAVFVPAVFHDKDGMPTPNEGMRKSFWTVKTADGELYYFDMEMAADGFVTNHPESVKSARYANGECYYSAYLGPSNGYSTLRNTFYRVNVKSLIPPGRPTPEPADPDQPLSGVTDIDIEVVIIPWDVVDDGYDLH